MYAGRGNFWSLDCRDAEEFQRQKLRASASLRKKSHLISGSLVQIHETLPPVTGYSLFLALDLRETEPGNLRETEAGARGEPKAGTRGELDAGTRGERGAGNLREPEGFKER